MCLLRLPVGLHLGPVVYWLSHMLGDGVSEKSAKLAELVSLICLVMAVWSGHGSDKLE